MGRHARQCPVGLFPGSPLKRKYTKASVKRPAVSVLIARRLQADDGTGLNSARWAYIKGTAAISRPSDPIECVM
jgi:hypothetical protein